jgi:hypothetical protein
MEKSTGSRSPHFLKHRCNSQTAIDAALAEGFDGVEIDLVWAGGVVVLGHEHGGGGEVLNYINFYDAIVAVNVKEYGMSPHLSLTTAREWFVFDVPGPELDLYCASGARVFGRFSIYENQHCCGQAAGMLLDDFTGTVPGQTALFYKYDRLVVTPPSDIALISNQLRGGRDSDFVTNRATYIIRKTLP